MSLGKPNNENYGLLYVIVLRNFYKNAFICLQQKSKHHFFSVDNMILNLASIELVFSIFRKKISRQYFRIVSWL